MENRICVFAKAINSRLTYIIEELFHEMHGFDIDLVTDEQTFASLPAYLPKICYAEKNIGNSLHIVPAALLFEKDIHPQSISVETEDQTPYFFRTLKENETSSFSFDLFAASFYLLSRYEEYLPHKTDLHGRFLAEESIAFKNGFLEKPIIEIWMQKLIHTINRQFGCDLHSKRQFRYVRTIDVDNIYAYRHKGPIINGIHLLKDWLKGEKNLARLRWRVISRQEEDPFFNLEELSNRLLSLDPTGANTHIFFHCGGYGKRDKKTIVPSLRYGKIRKHLSEKMNVGLHPSYRSAHTQWLFRLEKKILEWHIGKPVTSCRSHYLLFQIPEDYRKLEQTGITDDYSMGYSNNPGYRAGTSLPFHFYDLEKEKASKLLIHPLAVMDKTLHSNLRLTPQEAIAYIEQMKNAAEDVKGEFVVLFHNENQCDRFGWEGWQEVMR